MNRLDYKPLEDGVIVAVPKNWYLACCDCGLIHKFEFRVGKVEPTDKEQTLIVQIHRENRRTAAHRRGKGVKIVKISRKTKKKVVK